MGGPERCHALPVDQAFFLGVDRLRRSPGARGGVQKGAPVGEAVAQLLTGGLGDLLSEVCYCMAGPANRDARPTPVVRRDLRVDLPTSTCLLPRPQGLRLGGGALRTRV